MTTQPQSNPSRGPARLLRPAAWLFYIAIGLEILFMISPAALYFYSLYGPSLNVLDRFAATAWLTGFFLPHISITRCVILNAVPWAGGILALAGAVWFLAAAGQLYWNKFRGRGLVTSGFYGLSRHPQYTALALLGLGALLLWPRFLVLIAYVAMLFLYRSLAALEEGTCEETFGEAYRQYQARTPAIVPFIPHIAGLRVNTEARRGGSPAGHRALTAVAAIAAAVLVAFAVREYALTQITARYEPRAAVLSPALLSEDELLAAYRITLANPRVGEGVEEDGDGPLVVHVVPQDWRLADLPLDAAPEGGGHFTPDDFDRPFYRVLFSRARTHDPGAAGKGIVRSAYGIEPLVLASVDIETGRVIGIETPPAHVWWSDIPTPLF